jgi:hypothetical protein
MSIQSRKRNTKRPTERAQRAPQPYKHHIAIKAIGLIPARPKKTKGAFGGCTKAERARRILADK